MINRVTFVLVLLCLAAGGSVFELKHSVASMRDSLYRLDADIEDEKRRLAVLRADWAHVTRPDRLAELASKLGMFRAKSQHVVNVNQIGRREFLEMARHSYEVPLSSEATGVFRAKPIARLALRRSE